MSKVLVSLSRPTYRWRNEYGGLKVDQTKRLKELERENARLKRAVADPTLDKLILKESGRPSGQVTTSKPATNPLETRVLPLGNKKTGGEENA